MTQKIRGPFYHVFWTMRTSNAIVDYLRACVRARACVCVCTHPLTIIIVELVRTVDVVKWMMESISDLGIFLIVY